MLIMMMSQRLHFTSYVVFKLIDSADGVVDTQANVSLRSARLMFL